jgi:hypothetical protein
MPSADHEARAAASWCVRKRSATSRPESQRLTSRQTPIVADGRGVGRPPAARADIAVSRGQHPGPDSGPGSDCCCAAASSAGRTSACQRQEERQGGAGVDGGREGQGPATRSAQEGARQGLRVSLAGKPIPTHASHPHDPCNDLQPVLMLAQPRDRKLMRARGTLYSEDSNNRDRRAALGGTEDWGELLDGQWRASWSVQVLQSARLAEATRKAEELWVW